MKPSILFACTANAGRSVAAKVLAQHYAGERVDVTGLERPKGFDPAGTYTVVVTMGCGEACPFYAGARYDDWALDDPKGQDRETVRRIVAAIDGQVRRLLGEVRPDLALPPSVFDPAGRH